MGTMPSDKQTVLALTPLALLALLARVDALPPRACLAPHDGYPFCNTSLSVAARVDDLIGRLALEEKPFLLVAREAPLGNISRIGLPAYDWGGNCIHGVQSRCTKSGVCPTSFPNPIGLGATFNRSVWSGMGAVIGMELRYMYLAQVGEDHLEPPCDRPGLLVPNIGIVREPRWGRNLETPEKTLRERRVGAAVTEGLQTGTLTNASYRQS